MTQQAHLSDAFSLANGVAIPCLGYGTWRMQDGPETCLLYTSDAADE